MLRIKGNKGQTILEYAVLIAIVGAVFIGMQTYIKRAIQAGVKIAADQIGSQRQGLKEIDPLKGFKQEASINVVTDDTSNVKTSFGGRRTVIFDEKTEMSGKTSSESRR